MAKRAALNRPVEMTRWAATLLATARPRRMTLQVVVVLLLLARPLLAQSPRWDLRGGLPVGSEEERYLRALQVVGALPLHPWTVRALTPWEAERVAGEAGDHPWARELRATGADPDSLMVGWVPPTATVVANSGFPFGENDGTLWAGRGLTAAASAGIFARWGPVHLRLAPELFASQNAAFELTPNGQEGEAAFRDPKYPGAIDLPQRFGEGAYARLDPGDSWLSVRLPVLTAGASTAAQHWGPAVRYPLMLGDNAGGFPHLFVQTSGPVPIGIGSVHGRLIAGRLDQSEWSPAVAEEPRRFASAVVLAFRPRWLDGLELGVTRFADFIWPEEGIEPWHVLRPFSLRLTNPRNVAPTQITEENQIAGGFLHWVVPSVGVEVYAEIMRDDFPRDRRHFVVEPDDYGARVFGLERVLRRPDGALVAVRAEVVSSLANHSERGDRFRLGASNPLSPYRHGRVRQGHTQRGQLLASPAAYGGSAWTLGLDHYGPGGRSTVELFRQLRQDWRSGLGAADGDGTADVVYGVRVEGVRFRDGWELAWTVSPMLDLNRDLIEGNAAFNLHVSLAVRGMPG